MCRVYETKNGPYIRLCYRKGIRKGEHIPGRLMDGQGCADVPGVGVRRRASRVAPERVRRCSNCNLVLSRDSEGGLCGLCREAAESGLCWKCRRPAHEPDSCEQVWARFLVRAGSQ